MYIPYLYCILYKRGGGVTKVFGLFLGGVHVSFSVAWGGSYRYWGVKCHPPPQTINNEHSLSMAKPVCRRPPVWKVCIARGRNPPRTFYAFYIFTIKFSKSPPRTLQTFQSGMAPYIKSIFCFSPCNCPITVDAFVFLTQPTKPNSLLFLSVHCKSTNTRIQYYIVAMSTI